MTKNVALTALSASGHGLSETPKVGSQTMQLVVVRLRRRLYGAQVVKISLMDYVEQIVLNVAKLAFLTIQTQRRLADARSGNDSVSDKKKPKL